jgi:hypothetical protein
MTIDITPAETVAAPIEFNIVGVGKFDLPVLGQKGTPFGITSAFGVFQDAQSDEQKLSAWAMLVQALSDSYPQAVRVLARLDGEDVARVFTAWGEKSKEYDPKA